MKFKGQEYPVSLFKIMLHDTVADRLEFIRVTLKVPNNIEALTTIINHTYGELMEFHKHQLLEADPATNKDLPSNLP